MAGSAPVYDNIQMPSMGGIRVPTEIFGTAGAGNAAGTMDVDLYVALNGGGSSSVTLNAQQMSASVLVIGSMSSTTNNLVNFPAAAPGAHYFVKNSSGSSCTLKVTGQTGTAVANGSHVVLIANKTDVEQWGAAF